MVEPDRLQSFIATVESAITPLALAYARDETARVHRFQVSRAEGSRQVTYVFESEITDADAQDLIAAIRQDFPPIAYDI
jgi:hypothetical protein